MPVLTDWTPKGVLASCDDWVWVPPGAPARSLIAAVQEAAIECGHDASARWITPTQVWCGEPSTGERREQQLSWLDDLWADEGGFRLVARLAGRPIATGDTFTDCLSVRAQPRRASRRRRSQ